MNRKSRKWNPGIHLILFFLSICTLVPLAWTISSAFKSRQDLLSLSFHWIPREFVFSNFAEAMEVAPFGQYYLNTIMIVFGLLFIQLITITLAAYAFARLQFPGRDLLFFLFLMQLMIPAQSVVVPNYLTIRNLGLLDTKVAVALPYFASATGTFLLRQAFKSVPRELEDVAAIDGCAGLRFVYYVLWPLSKPAIIAFSIVSIVYHWNEFFWPLIVTDTPNARVLTVGLSILAQSIESSPDWTLAMAGTLVVAFPLFLVFVVLQRSFIQSFMRAGLKG